MQKHGSSPKNQTLYLSRSCITSQPELNHRALCSWEKLRKWVCSGCLCAPKNNPKEDGGNAPAGHLASPTPLLVSIQIAPKDSQRKLTGTLKMDSYSENTVRPCFSPRWPLWPASSSKPAQRGLVASPGWFTFWKHKIFQNFFINYMRIFPPVRQTDTLTPCIWLSVFVSSLKDYSFEEINRASLCTTNVWCGFGAFTPSPVFDLQFPDIWGKSSNQTVPSIQALENSTMFKVLATLVFPSPIMKMRS